jgi:hypothetical protein
MFAERHRYDEATLDAAKVAFTARFAEFARGLTIAGTDALGGLPAAAFDDEELFRRLTISAHTAAFDARYGQLKRDLAIPDTCYATDVAARASVCPSELCPHTRVAGHAVLASTGPGRRVADIRGALPI